MKQQLLESLAMKLQDPVLIEVRNVWEKLIQLKRTLILLAITLASEGRKRFFLDPIRVHGWV